MAAVDPRIPSTALTPEEAKPIDAFLAANPNELVQLKETPTGVTLSRNPTPASPQDLLVLNTAMTKVFARMQESGYICQLPQDPAETHMGQSTLIARYPSEIRAGPDQN